MMKTIDLLNEGTGRVSPTRSSGEHLYLLYDGACGMCRRVIAALESRDRQKRIEAIPFQAAHRHLPSPPFTPELRERCERAVHVITPDGRILSAGRAMLFVLQTIGWGGRLPHILSYPPFIYLVELGYAIVARNRGFFSRFLFRR